MQKAVLLIAVLLGFIHADAQKNEWLVDFNAGLFSFAGKSATDNSFINNRYNKTSEGYTNNPYGSRPGLSYGLSAGLRHVFSNNLLFGIDAGYELLRSRVNINSVVDADATNPLGGVIAYQASGKTMFGLSTVNFYPYTGYRFRFGTVSLDLMAGTDLAYSFSGKENGKATATNGTTYTTSQKQGGGAIDFRPRAQLAAHYHGAGVYAGYSYGLINYQQSTMGGNHATYSRMLRFGIQYRLSK